MDRHSFRGIYAIPVTPFTADLDIDEAALRATLKFCMDAGVHGLVANANISEVAYLSDEEKKLTATMVVEAASGKIPAIIGVSSAHHRLSAAMARHAEQIGADAIMAMPPTFHPPTPGEIKTFYRELASSCSLPIIVQNANSRGATPMSASFLAELIAEIPSVRFIKEETAFPGPLTSDVRRIAGDQLHGVMGGRAGIGMMEELRHGICGNMPACEFADVHVALWNAVEAGDQMRARQIYGRLLPLLNLEIAYGIPLCKDVLKMRGIIPVSNWRQPGFRSLDAAAKAEVAQGLEDLRDLLLPTARDIRPY